LKDNQPFAAAEGRLLNGRLLNGSFFCRKRAGDRCLQKNAGRVFGAGAGVRLSGEKGKACKRYQAGKREI
jgi:hypothetical protein